MSAWGLVKLRSKIAGALNISRVSFQISLACYIEMSIVDHIDHENGKSLYRDIIALTIWENYLLRQWGYHVN